MGKLHDTYRLTITTLSPLHIGTGTTLRQGYDFVTRNNQTWVIDAGQLADMLYEQAPDDFGQMVQGRPADELIPTDAYQTDSRLFRYVMRGEPRSQRRGSEIQQLIKDAWDQPYIPGSSLKGALRTTLAFVGFEQRNLKFSPSSLASSDYRYAAQAIERQILNVEGVRRGDVPNHDLLRALQISDSSADIDKKILLLNVQVMAGSKPGSPVELEAISHGVTFTATLTLDGFLRQPDVAQELGWQDDQLTWLDNVPRVVNYFTKLRVADEVERWKNVKAPIRSFYSSLVKTFLSLDNKSEFLLQLGWGGGWDSKTLGDHLTRDPNAFYEVVKKFERQMDRQRSFQRGDRYPKSRRLVVRNEQPVSPLGWIKVKMERIG